MNDANGNPINLLNILGASAESDLDLTSVSTKYPVIANNTILPMVINEVEVAPGKNDTSKHNLRLKLATVAPVNDTQGKPIAPGHALSHYISLTPTEKRSRDNVLRDIKGLLEAAYGDGANAVNLNMFDFTSLLGVQVTVRVSVQAETAENAEQNRVRFIKKAETDTPQT